MPGGAVIFRHLLPLLFLLVPMWAWGANVYLDTSCAFNGTGAAEDCAISGGAAGAFNTGASITYGAGNVYYIKRGTTVTNWPSPASQTVTIDDYGSAVACPTISGGLTPTTAEGFIPQPESPLCRAGVWVSAGLLDYAGIPFKYPPPIGAYECRTDTPFIGR